MLRLEDLTQEPHYRHISLSVRAGEVLGVTGLLGDGRSEIFRTVFGDAGKYQGNIIVGGKPVQMHSTQQALALGIGIQNLPEGAAISLPLRQEGSSRGRAFLLGTLSGSVEPIFGILVVLVAAGVRPLMPWLLSFAAGAMLYVVVEELVPQAHSKAGTCGFVGGFLIMMILDVALG